MASGERLTLSDLLQKESEGCKNLCLPFLCSHLCTPGCTAPVPEQGENWARSLGWEEAGAGHGEKGWGQEEGARSIFRPTGTTSVCSSQETGWKPHDLSKRLPRSRSQEEDRTWQAFCCKGRSHLCSRHQKGLAANVAAPAMPSTLRALTLYCYTTTGTSDLSPPPSAL